MNQNKMIAAGAAIAGACGGAFLNYHAPMPLPLLLSGGVISASLLAEPRKGDPATPLALFFITSSIGSAVGSVAALGNRTTGLLSGVGHTLSLLLSGGAAFNEWKGASRREEIIEWAENFWANGGENRNERIGGAFFFLIGALIPVGLDALLNRPTLSIGLTLGSIFVGAFLSREKDYQELRELNSAIPFATGAMSSVALYSAILLFGHLQLWETGAVPLIQPPQLFQLIAMIACGGVVGHTALSMGSDS